MNDQELLSALRSAERALRPLYNRVFDDNHELITDTSGLTAAEIEAGYFAYRRVEAALKANAAAQAGTVTEVMMEALRNIDAEAPAKEPRDHWTSTDLDEAFYEGKLRGFWEMALYAREALTAALGAQTPPEAVTEAWQPIETAPNDGKPVLVFGGRHVEPEIVPADGDWWRSYDGTATPTHWQPLPTPPVNQSEGADRG